MDKDKIGQLVAEAIVELHQEGIVFLGGEFIGGFAREDTVLLGPDGLLDSLGLVNLIVLVEEKLQAVGGKPIALADEKALSQKNSPFRTVRSLVSYIGELYG